MCLNIVQTEIINSHKTFLPYCKSPSPATITFLFLDHSLEEMGPLAAVTDFTLQASLIVFKSTEAVISVVSNGF